MRAISSMATRSVLADLARAAALAGLPTLQIESVGGVDAAHRVAGGEAFDLVFLAEPALRGLADAGHVDAATLVPLFVSQVAVAVPSRAPDEAAAPQGSAFRDAREVRAALRAARRIGYSTGPSGTALIDMIARWGLTDELGDRLVQARPGVPVARLLAEDEVDLGLQQLSELIGAPGIRILGTLPADCAIETVFAGAVASVSNVAAAGRELLDFLRSPGAAPVITGHSFSVPTSTAARSSAGILRRER
ncbi:substrate-binding domain-containing protein [Microbacterium sp. Root180]|uniref:substrate-binding domain-containing protein n=1 Tax=Microbacterium sp. Root180 TaxID=1736483 RepID=UPI0006F29CBA|nr:substrate-binding domain-containing protein [Microbacterium sp. Root180]KRB38409.1 molybdenum ABC transporter substrate-binding protein [Microbacterium sp. Root180]